MAKTKNTVAEATTEATEVTGVSTSEATPTNSTGERLITRTILSTSAQLMCVDVSTGETLTVDYIVGGKVESDKLLKMAKKNKDTDTFKVVAVVGIDYIEKMYGIAPSIFMQYAIELDPATRKSIN